MIIKYFEVNIFAQKYTPYYYYFALSDLRTKLIKYKLKYNSQNYRVGRNLRDNLVQFPMRPGKVPASVPHMSI